MKYLAVLCALALAGCATASVKTTIERDTTTGQTRFIQEVKAPPGAIVELVGQNFVGSVKYNPETKTYDIDVRSGQDVQGIQSEGLDLAALAEIMKMVNTP